MKTNLSEVDVLLEQMRSQVYANKQSESYSCLLSDSLEVREKGKQTAEITKRPKNRKRKERRKIKDKKRFCNAIESRKQFIKNLSNEQLTDKQITLLSRGLKFIPTPATKENLIRRQLSRISINLRDECNYNVFFTGKKTNLILSTLSRTGNHQSSHL